MMNKMNYQYNNPNINLHVDLEIAKAFAASPRTSVQVENFGIWASMSKDAKEIENILQNVQIVDLIQEKQATM